METEIVKLISQELQLEQSQVLKTVRLLEAGDTIPFIARYRKEATGNMDEMVLIDLDKKLKYFEDLNKRKHAIIKSIKEQGKLSNDLELKISKCYDLTTLEDIYLPFKRKKQTKAAQAREKGLEPLAKILMKQHERNIEQIAKNYVNQEVKSISEALNGAKEIIAEWVNESPVARERLRALFHKKGAISSKRSRKKKDDPDAEKFRDYFSYTESIKHCAGHRFLAVIRGENQDYLNVHIEADEEEVYMILDRIFVKGSTEVSRYIKDAVRDAYKRLLQPSLETEFKKSYKEKADKEAIEVFARNLHQLLLAPPLPNRKVLALDPGFRTGCKLAALDEAGNLLGSNTIFPHPPQTEKDKSTEIVTSMINKYNINTIAIGNGTASRETEAFVNTVIKGFDKPIDVFMVNESGASIYSASDVAREEFPKKDVTVRGTVSIGRRLQDPLAELVKIEPKSIGVGQYQHDVNQKMLGERLEHVVKSCVNAVGININSANKYILKYVSGLSTSIAENIVEWRIKNGKFANRNQIKEISGIGEKSFEQCAGFLRIPESGNPLDNTTVHPETYGLVEQISKDINVSIEKMIGNVDVIDRIKIDNYTSLEFGLASIKAMLSELVKKTLDPRGESSKFQFSASVRSIEDVKPGMKVPGIVTNITNFGAFVDIGVKQDGLVHVSEMANTFVKDPNEVLSLREEVLVKVLEVDANRRRIALSLKS